MFRRSIKLAQFQRGSWAVGSKHQKNQMLNPTLFLYRFPGKFGPGPYTMKYWWTLGTFPSGIEIPFRLQEFLASYQQSHVPEEVEDWLNVFIKDPVDNIVPAVEAFASALDALPECDRTVGYKAIEPSVQPVLAPLKKVCEIFMMDVPATSVRAVASDAALKKQLLDEAFEYVQCVKQSGSTPHRRLGRGVMEMQQQLPVSESAVAQKTDDTAAHPIQLTDDAAAQIGAALEVDNLPTQPDEKRLIRMLATFAEGSMKKRKFSDAADLMESSLMFAHDAQSRSRIHSDAASAHNLNGDFKEAEWHAKESVLLEKNPRGYANWACSVAYQDDFERAAEVVQDGLALFPAHPALSKVDETLKGIAAEGRQVNPLHRGARYQRPAQMTRGLDRAGGKNWRNEFDYVIFNNKFYAAKMDPSNSMPGSIFRRVGTLGLGYTSTQQFEPL